MLAYVATYPRCGSGMLRWLIIRNFRRGRDRSAWIEHPDHREALAGDPELYLSKTHGLPFDSYAPGERAIQVVRHPGQAIASHARLYHARQPDRPRALKRFIAGHPDMGDWTSYHRRWAEAPLPLLRLRYEAVLHDPAQAVAEIARFLGLPMPETVVAETAEEAHRRNPGRNPNADPDAWREMFDDKDLRRLTEAHGALAAELGYAW